MTLIPSLKEGLTQEQRDMADKLTALADRCEAAAGADRELDCRIWSAFNGGGFDTFRSVVPDLGQWRALYYTASLDAAMALVPADGSMQFAEFSWSWEPSEPGVWPAASVRWYPPHKSGPDWHAFVVSARTPALTLCAAALRARAVHLLSGAPS